MTQTHLHAPQRAADAKTHRQKDPRVRRRERLRGTGYHMISGLLATAFLLPLLWSLLSSLKSPAEANQQPPTWLPHSLSLQNYTNLAGYGAGIGRYLWNSVALSVLVVIGTVVVTTLAGYGFARFSFFGKNALFGTTLLILMVPYATILIPLYIVLGKLHLTNSVFGLALVLIMFQMPFGTFLMRNSFESIPREIEEAAAVDGCGPMQVVRHVSLRLVAPGVATVALFSFLASWNEYLAPLIFLGDGSQYTLPLMLGALRSNTYGVIDYGVLQAGVVVTIVPVLVLYLFLQRYYVTGLTNGAVRG